MKQYLGVKIVHAEPQQREKWENGKFEDRADHSLVDGYKVVYEDGYVSWSPKEVFEKAYKPYDKTDKVYFRNIDVFNDGCWRFSIQDDINILGYNPNQCSLPTSFDFGQAIKLLKEGKRVARKGWNGKGMFLIYIFPYLTNQFTVVEKPEIVGTLLPYIAMKTADNGLVPWLASQTDMLAEDWQIVE